MTREEAMDSRDAEIRTLKDRVMELEGIAWLMLWQDCAEKDSQGRYLDNMCMSAYEWATGYFESTGRLKGNGRIYRETNNETP